MPLKLIAAVERDEEMDHIARRDKPEVRMVAARLDTMALLWMELRPGQLGTRARQTIGSKAPLRYSMITGGRSESRCQTRATRNAGWPFVRSFDRER
jgi:hypothetical protein